MLERSDEDLLADIGVEVEAPKAKPRSAEDERVHAGFSDIQRFVAEHGRLPEHGAGGDIFERLYAVRLDRLRELTQFHELLASLDHGGLLAVPAPEGGDEPEDDEALLASLGVAPAQDITELRHVRSAAEKRAAEEIAAREPCPDFDTFKPLFDAVQADLDEKRRETRPFGVKAEIEEGRFFILDGQKAYIAEKGETFRQEYGDTDARLRVVFDNGTQSNLLARSLQRALTKDEKGRRISESGAGPLFGSKGGEADLSSGTIYVLRSKSDLPAIAENRDLIHKIGVTGGGVKTRIANAAQHPTFLMADVEVVAIYELSGVNRLKLEALLHQIFADARIAIEVTDRFGEPVVPREWFLVPLPVIDQVVDRIRNGSISGLHYDPAAAELTTQPPS